jgi:adenylate cyclase
VIGDPVNLAAKLEKHTKAERAQALCTCAAYQQALAQGYRPARPAQVRPQCRVAGVDAPLDLAVLAE